MPANSTKDNKQTKKSYTYRYLKESDVNAFALCDLFKLFLHPSTNIGTAIEPGGVQLDTIIVLVYYGSTKMKKRT